MHKKKPKKAPWVMGRCYKFFRSEVAFGKKIKGCKQTYTQNTVLISVTSLNEKEEVKSGVKFYNYSKKRSKL